MQQVSNISTFKISSPSLFISFWHKFFLKSQIIYVVVTHKENYLFFQVLIYFKIWLGKLGTGLSLLISIMPSNLSLHRDTGTRYLLSRGLQTHIFMVSPCRTSGKRKEGRKPCRNISAVQNIIQALLTENLKITESCFGLVEEFKGHLVQIPAISRDLPPDSLL